MNNWILGQHAMCMEEAGGQGGEGGGGGATTTTTTTSTGGEGSTEGGGALGGAEEEGGEGGEGGESKGALGGAEGGEGEINWEKITPDEYFGRVKIPEIAGVNINKESVTKKYGEFCRKYHISPEAAAEFLKMEGDSFLKNVKTTRDAKAKEAAEIKANFDAQGKKLSETYTREQINEAVKVLKTSEFSGDKDFMKVATSVLANNSTLVKLILNWGEHHKVDGTSGAGNGAGEGGEQGFAARWTGHRI